MAIRPLENEQELLTRASHGDREAFAALFDAYYDPLGQYLHRFTQSKAETQDIVQDVFIKLWLRREELAQIRHFWGWLVVMSRNHALNGIEKRLTQLERQGDWVNLFEGEEEPGKEGPWNEYRMLLERAVDRLPPQQQKAYRLARQEGLTYKQIAEKLGISPETVKRNLIQAIKKLKQQLGNSQIDPMIMIILLTPLAQ